MEIKSNELFFARTKPNGIIPTKRFEDAGFDVHSAETETIVINPCSVKLVDTGIAIGCSPDWFPKFFDKGGMGSKGIIVGAGVGDSGYRNGYFIPLINTNYDKYLVITTQTQEEVDECELFDINANKFVKGFDEVTEKWTEVLMKRECIVKFSNKAITQFVMLPVPKFDIIKEITWEELQTFESERGMGKLGSSGK